MWERRYGVLAPKRTPGGSRIYSAEDERRVKEMNRYLGEGFSAAGAARLVLDGLNDLATPSGPNLPTMLDELTRASIAFDEVDANQVLDRALERFTLETVIGDLVMPFLYNLGALWEAGEVSIAQEHFATALIRGRLLGIARSWGTGSGPLALLANPPGEYHDLGLVCFGIALRERGWRITLLGANTPISTLAEAAGALEPALIVISSMDHRRFRKELDEIKALARAHEVAVAGPGATADLAERTGAQLLASAPIEAARRVEEAMAA